MFHVHRRDTYTPNTSKYILKIRSKTPGKYELIVPIGFNPDIKDTQLIDEFLSKLRVVKGTAEFSIKKAKYGPGLRVIGSGNVVINAVKKGGKYLNLDLSMMIGEKKSKTFGYEFHKILLNSENIDKVKIYVGIDNTLRYYLGGYFKKTDPKYQDVHKGWGKISTKYVKWESNRARKNS